MKKVLMGLMVAGLVLGFTGMSMAAESDTATQTMDLNVDEIAVIDVTANPGVMTIVAPATGGETPADVTDDTTFVQYTSTVTFGTTRSITAQMGNMEYAPSGTQLTLTASGMDDFIGEGTSAGAVIVDEFFARNIITGITSCATGTGAADGALLTYSLEVVDPWALIADEQTTPTITLTLTDLQ